MPHTICKSNQTAVASVRLNVVKIPCGAVRAQAVTANVSVAIKDALTQRLHSMV
jgi:hypothetical protein